MQTTPANFYEFGAFQLDPVKRLLRRLDGTPVPLTPRVFDTLLYMVEHHDSVMDKERIMEAVWPDSIVEENNLAQAIWKLRQVFGETPGSHSYIVTVPGRGYRFVAEVNKRNGDIVSIGPADSTTTPMSLQEPTEADPTADRHQLLPKARHGTSPSDWRIFGAAIAAIVIVGLAALFFVRYRSLPASVRAPGSPAPADAVLSVPARIAEKSIAVLPFDNLSEEKQNAYFAEGIQNEILTRLATLRDLKVISRTSTAKYQSKPDNLKTVAQELGVSTILEGAVQRAGDKVRVNVQLIDARTDTHVWAKSYDRDLKDVLAVESEVSQEIAEALQAKLSPSESHVLASAQTRDAEAYDLFLRGEYELHQAECNCGPPLPLIGADAFYQQALTRDPNFAEAAAELARSRLLRHWNISPLAAAELEEVKSLIDRALALAPNSPEAHFALGLFFYWRHRQYENGAGGV